MKNSSLRKAAALLVLSAMLLRGMIPLGWMPTAQPGQFLALCTAQGLAQLKLDEVFPGDDGSTNTSQTVDNALACPFAIAAAPGNIGQALVPGIACYLPLAASRPPQQILASRLLDRANLARAPPA